MQSKSKKRRKPAQCIVKASPIIKQALKRRFKELGLSLREVARDSKERGKPIAVSSLSRYFTKEAYVPSGLSQEQIIFLCLRYCISIKLTVKVLPYNEEQANINLQKIFKI